MTKSDLFLTLIKNEINYYKNLIEIKKNLLKNLKAVEAEDLYIINAEEDLLKYTGAYEALESIYKTLEGFE